jgi:signal transduction histidine kinase/DNA-binding NarL/FixJ family response regulator
VAELDALKLLRRIEEGVAGKTGEAFFRQIVCEVSRALNAHSAFTSWLLPNRRARMLAFWSGGAYQECLEYALEGTPCAFVYRGEITSYARNIGDVFPVDRAWFEQLGVHSYLGIPVKEETGTVCGHLAVMDTCERDWAEADLDVLRLFSLRSAAEINRTRYQQELEDRNQALRHANEQLSAEIDRRAAAESQLAAAKAAAESANHAKSVFISQMSHELRTPLNGILGFTQLLKRDGATPPHRLTEGLEVIERSGEHLLKLVNELLDLAKIEAGKLELSLAPADIPELLEHVTSLARVRAANAGLALSVRCDNARFAPVLADERAIRQILLNLLGNAVKFTERGGWVRLEAQGSLTADNRQWVRFTVEDSGIGIDEHELARIFEPFHRVVATDRIVEGTGLGLTITQRLVDALGGTLSVRSQKNKGTAFTLECVFDLAPAVADRSLAVGEIAGFAGDIRTILLVDDDADNRVLVTSLLESIGFRVLSAGNGRDALSYIRAFRPDLILTDLLMPSMTGLQLVRALRVDSSIAQIPVIAMSASASDFTREEALEAGCTGFLSKPLRLGELLEILGNELHLQWQHRAPAAPAAVQQLSCTDSQPLEPELATRLLDLAMRGDVMGIMAAIDSALSKECAASTLVLQLRTLAQNYDIRGVREALATVSRRDRVSG